MRILRIQFENLNSLRSGDIDLEHGPLAEAGIFAITGPTGAGKSTLLDALTLALYGRAARYDTEPNPENMMSRHTGSCRAEVLFEVPGGRFQARWELRRARNKPDGRLQQAKRTVVRDGCGTVLAEKIDHADRLIEELTGLDYERFRRSVLLAQGEFARFLKATPGERGALLESLTGTTIYSQLSELAYREAACREQALLLQREALGRTVLLGEEERAAKTAEIERLTAGLEAATGQRAALSARIGQGGQLAARLREEEGILQKQTALAGEAAAAEPQRERLRRHRLALPFLAALEIMDALERQCAEEGRKADDARAAAAQARTALASGVQAAGAIASGALRQVSEAVAKAGAEEEALAAELAGSQTVVQESAAVQEAAANALARLLKGRTVEEVAAEGSRMEQRHVLLGDLRMAMEKRDNAAAEAARLADEEAQLIEQMDAAAREKGDAQGEAELQAALLERARADVEAQERIAGLEGHRADLQPGSPCPLCGALEHPYARPEALLSSSLEEARRNLNAARTASDTAAREARIAAEGLTRLEERLAGVRRRRGEIRWKQAAEHEAFEQRARLVRVFTAESLAEAVAELEKTRAAHAALAGEIRKAENEQHAAEKRHLTAQGAVAQLREKLEGHRNRQAGLLRQRDDLEKAARKLAAHAAMEELANVPAESGLAAQFQNRWATLDEAGAGLEALRGAWIETSAKAGERRANLEGVQKAAAQQKSELNRQLEGSAFASPETLRAARLDAAEAGRIEALQAGLEARAQALAGQLQQVREQARRLRDEEHAPEGEALAALEREQGALETHMAAAAEARTTLRNELTRDDRERQAHVGACARMEEEARQLAVWDRLRGLIGSANGAAFRQFAQGLSLDLLVRHANRHLARLSDRYRLRRVEGGELSLEITDLHQAGALRPMTSLSGGESFLASLALALGLSDIAGRNVRIDSLFIDEGFGSLDPATLDLAVGALDALRLSNKTVGVISHVELLKERIPVQIRVEKRTGGISVLHLPE